MFRAVLERMTPLDASPPPSERGKEVNLTGNCVHEQPQVAQTQTRLRHDDSVAHEIEEEARQTSVAGQCNNDLPAEPENVPPTHNKRQEEMPNLLRIQQLLDAAAEADDDTEGRYHSAISETTTARGTSPLHESAWCDGDDFDHGLRSAVRGAEGPLLTGLESVPVGDLPNGKTDHGEPEARCYADGFGELDPDLNGHLRYVGLGSTASVVDNCVGLRRHIERGLEKKGYEPEVAFLTSPEATLVQDRDGDSGGPPHPTATSGAGSTILELPPMGLVDTLITIYTTRLNFVFPITTERRLRHMYANLRVQHENHRCYNNSHAAAVFSCLAVATPLLQAGDPALHGLQGRWRDGHLGPAFYNEAMRHVNLSVSLGNQSQEIVVALGLLSMYLAETGSQAEAWICVGRAIRNAQDLGLHRSPERLRLPEGERNTRRCIWWCLYILERQLCTALGRPLCIDDQDCDTEVPQPLANSHSGQSNGTKSSLAGFASMVHLHRIIGSILKIVNSVRNADAWRRSLLANEEDAAAKKTELRARVREANDQLQAWARDMVPPEIKTAKDGTLLAEKHIALSSFFSAVMLLHRVFMGNPHRPSPLAESSQALPRSAKAATDCIRETAEFVENVPPCHYLVFHGQYVFVSAIVLLQCVRSSDDPRFVYTALRDVERAMDALSLMQAFWKGARKCRATVEEYLDFTFHVLQGGQKGKCQFACGETGPVPGRLSTNTSEPATMATIGGRRVDANGQLNNTSAVPLSEIAGITTAAQSSTPYVRRSEKRSAPTAAQDSLGRTSRRVKRSRNHNICHGHHNFPDGRNLNAEAIQEVPIIPSTAACVCSSTSSSGLTSTEKSHNPVPALSSFAYDPARSSLLGTPSNTTVVTPGRTVLVEASGKVALPQQQRSLEDQHFDNTIGSFLGAISPDFHLQDSFFEGIIELDLPASTESMLLL